MADKTDFTPELTLTPNLDAAAAAEAPQAPESPALTLDPTGAVVKILQEVMLRKWWML